MRKKENPTQDAEKTTSPLRISAKEKALILKAVYDKHGELTPDFVVRESNPKNRQGIAHRLADLVGWGDDDATAARKWRIECARSVIRSAEPLLVDLGVIQIKAPYYVRDPMKDPGKQGYAKLLSIKTEEEAAGDLMQAEITSAVSSLERAHNIAVALGLEQDAADIGAALAALGHGVVRCFACQGLVLRGLAVAVMGGSTRFVSARHGQVKDLLKLRDNLTQKTETFCPTLYLFR